MNPPHPDVDSDDIISPDDSDDIISEAVEAVEDVEDVNPPVNPPHPDDIIYEAIVHSEDSVDIFDIIFWYLNLRLLIFKNNQQNKLLL